MLHPAPPPRRVRGSHRPPGPGPQEYGSDLRAVSASGDASTAVSIDRMQPLPSAEQSGERSVRECDRRKRGKYRQRSKGSAPRRRRPMRGLQPILVPPREKKASATDDRPFATRSPVTRWHLRTGRRLQASRATKAGQGWPGRSQQQPPRAADACRRAWHRGCAGKGPNRS